MYPTAYHSLPTMTAAPRAGRLLYVVLIALAWLQLSYASHQFEHAAGDLMDSCAVCSHFDRLEHAVAPDVESPQLPQTHATFLPQPVHSAATRFERHYLSRAPPAV